MAVGSIGLDRDLTLPIDEMRAAPISSRIGDIGFPNDQILSTLPEMRRGGVAAALVKVVGRVHNDKNEFGDTGWRSGHNVYAAANAHLAYYRILDQTGEARILRTGKDMAGHVQEWSDAEDRSDLPVGLIIGMEGADPILWPEQLEEWWENGVRVVGLTYAGASTYGHGESMPDLGITPAGRELLREMETIGAILDITHTSDQTVRDELDAFNGPVIASHSNSRTLVRGYRQQPDELLQAVIDRGGVIGTSFATWMLYKDYEVTYVHDKKRRDVFPREAVTLEDVADHIDHICQMAGNSEHAAIGGDTDGQSAPGGKDGFPGDFDTVADFQKLGPILKGRGYSDTDVENVLYRNWQRFYEKHLPS